MPIPGGPSLLAPIKSTTEPGAQLVPIPGGPSLLAPINSSSAPGAQLVPIPGSGTSLLTPLNSSAVRENMAVPIPSTDRPSLVTPLNNSAVRESMAVPIQGRNRPSHVTPLDSSAVRENLAVPIPSTGQTHVAPLPTVSASPAQTQAMSPPAITPAVEPDREPPSAPALTTDPPKSDSSVDFATASIDPSDKSETGLLKALELRLFNREYSSDTSIQRLSRLEDFIFGGEAKGEVKTRLEKLSKILDKVPARVASTPAGNATFNTRPKPKGLLAIINQGIDNYNSHRFHNAEDDFNDALELAPGMPRIYVYLGVTLLQLNQRTSALDAMNAAYELDPFGTYGRYAKHCLIVLMGDEEVRKRGPKDNLNIVKGTLDKVNRNAESDAQRHSSVGSSNANFKGIAANPFANSLTNDQGAYSNENALKSSFVRADAQIQAVKARDDAAKRAASAQESANNLKSLITAKLLPGDAKLRAFGTTLNARYYGDETYNLAPWYIPRERTRELKAQAVTMKSLKVSNKKKAKPKH